MKKTLSFKTFLLFFIVTSLALSSCKKDGGSGSTPVKTDNLTGKTWTSNKIEFQQTDGSWQEQHDDDYHFAFNFNSDNTFSVTQTYFNGGHGTSTGTWHLINNNTQLTLEGSAYKGTYSVTQLSSSTLQWTVISPGFWGTNNAVRETFAH